MHGQTKKKMGNICLFFADERYLWLSKNLQFLGITALCVLFV